MNPFLSQKFRFCSFICIVLVVFVHSYNMHNRYLQPWTTVDEPLTFTSFVEYFIANGISRFMIPLLFAMSGYLFALQTDRPFGEQISKRAKTLLLPYFIWSFIGLLIAVLFSYWPATKEAVYAAMLQPVHKTFNEYKLQDWLLCILWPTSFQLWFLRCLFVYNLLYPLLLKGLIKVPVILFALFGLLWLATFGIILVEGEGLFFFTLGVWLCKKKKDIEHKPGWLNLTVCMVVYLGTSLIKTWLAFHTSGYDSVAFLLLTVLHKTTIFAGLLTVWFGCDKAARFCLSKNWFRQLTAFSFFIYVLHVPLVTYLIDPLFALLKSIQHYRLITFIFLPLVIIAFCTVTGWVLRKAVPAIYSILTGGRGF